MAQGHPHRRILEVGCGTAVPSLYLLHRMFHERAIGSNEYPKTSLHMQDYNSSVLRLVRPCNTHVMLMVTAFVGNFAEYTPNMVCVRDWLMIV